MDKRIKVSVSVRESLAERATVYAYENDLPLSRVYDRALFEFLKRWEDSANGNKKDKARKTTV